MPYPSNLLPQQQHQQQTVIVKSQYPIKNQIYMPPLRSNQNQNQLTIVDRTSLDKSVIEQQRPATIIGHYSAQIPKHITGINKGTLNPVHHESIDPDDNIKWQQIGPDGFANVPVENNVLRSNRGGLNPVKVQDRGRYHLEGPGAAELVGNVRIESIRTPAQFSNSVPIGNMQESKPINIVTTGETILPVDVRMPGKRVGLHQKRNNRLLYRSSNLQQAKAVQAANHAPLFFTSSRTNQINRLQLQKMPRVETNGIVESASSRQFVDIGSIEKPISVTIEPTNYKNPSNLKRFTQNELILPNSPVTANLNPQQQMTSNQLFTTQNNQLFSPLPARQNTQNSLIRSRNVLNEEYPKNFDKKVAKTIAFNQQALKDVVANIKLNKEFVANSKKGGKNRGPANIQYSRKNFGPQYKASLDVAYPKVRRNRKNLYNIRVDKVSPPASATAFDKNILELQMPKIGMNQLPNTPPQNMLFVQKPPGEERVNNENNEMFDAASDMKQVDETNDLFVHNLETSDQNKASIERFTDVMEKQFLTSLLKKDDSLKNGMNMNMLKNRWSGASEPETTSSLSSNPPQSFLRPPESLLSPPQSLIGPGASKNDEKLKLEDLINSPCCSDKGNPIELNTPKINSESNGKRESAPPLHVETNYATSKYPNKITADFLVDQYLKHMQESEKEKKVDKNTMIQSNDIHGKIKKWVTKNYKSLKTKLIKMVDGSKKPSSSSKSHKKKSTKKQSVNSTLADTRHLNNNESIAEIQVGNETIKLDVVNSNNSNTSSAGTDIAHMKNDEIANMLAKDVCEKVYAHIREIAKVDIEQNCFDYFLNTSQANTTDSVQKNEITTKTDDNVNKTSNDGLLHAQNTDTESSTNSTVKKWETLKNKHKNKPDMNGTIASLIKDNKTVNQNESAIVSQLSYNTTEINSKNITKVEEDKDVYDKTEKEYYPTLGRNLLENEPNINVTLKENESAPNNTDTKKTTKQNKNTTVVIDFGDEINLLSKNEMLSDKTINTNSTGNSESANYVNLTISADSSISNISNNSSEYLYHDKPDINKNSDLEIKELLSSASDTLINGSKSIDGISERFDRNMNQTEVESKIDSIVNKILSSDEVFGDEDDINQPQIKSLNSSEIPFNATHKKQANIRKAGEQYRNLSNHQRKETGAMTTDSTPKFTKPAPLMVASDKEMREGVETIKNLSNYQNTSINPTLTKTNDTVTTELKMGDSTAAIGNTPKASLKPGSAKSNDSVAPEKGIRDGTASLKPASAKPNDAVTPEKGLGEGAPVIENTPKASTKPTTKPNDMVTTELVNMEKMAGNADDVLEAHIDFENAVKQANEKTVTETVKKHNTTIGGNDYITVEGDSGAGGNSGIPGGPVLAKYAGSGDLNVRIHTSTNKTADANNKKNIDEETMKTNIEKEIIDRSKKIISNVEKGTNGTNTSSHFPNSTSYFSVKVDLINPNSNKNETLIEKKVDDADFNYLLAKTIVERGQNVLAKMGKDQAIIMGKDQVTNKMMKDQALDIMGKDRQSVSKLDGTQANSNNHQEANIKSGEVTHNSTRKYSIFTHTNTTNLVKVNQSGSMEGVVAKIDGNSILDSPVTLTKDQLFVTDNSTEDEDEEESNVNPVIKEASNNTSEKNSSETNSNSVKSKETKEVLNPSEKDESTETNTNRAISNSTKTQKDNSSSSVTDIVFENPKTNTQTGVATKNHSAASNLPSEYTYLDNPDVEKSSDIERKDDALQIKGDMNSSNETNPLTEYLYLNKEDNNDSGTEEDTPQKKMNQTESNPLLPAKENKPKGAMSNSTKGNINELNDTVINANKRNETQSNTSFQNDKHKNPLSNNTRKKESKGPVPSSKNLKSDSDNTSLFSTGVYNTNIDIDDTTPNATIGKDQHSLRVVIHLKTLKNVSRISNKSRYISSEDFYPNTTDIIDNGENPNMRDNVNGAKDSVNSTLDGYIKINKTSHARSSVLTNTTRTDVATNMDYSLILPNFFPKRNERNSNNNHKTKTADNKNKKVDNDLSLFSKNASSRDVSRLESKYSSYLNKLLDRYNKKIANDTSTNSTVALNNDLKTMSKIKLLSSSSLIDILDVFFKRTDRLRYKNHNGRLRNNGTDGNSKQQLAGKRIQIQSSQINAGKRVNHAEDVDEKLQKIAKDEIKKITKTEKEKKVVTRSFLNDLNEKKKSTLNHTSVDRITTSPFLRSISTSRRRSGVRARPVHGRPVHGISKSRILHQIRQREILNQWMGEKHITDQSLLKNKRKIWD